MHCIWHTVKPPVETTSSKWPRPLSGKKLWKFLLLLTSHKQPLDRWYLVNFKKTSSTFLQKFSSLVQVTSIQKCNVTTPYCPISTLSRNWIVRCCNIIALLKNRTSTIKRNFSKGSTRFLLKIGFWHEWTFKTWGKSISTVTVIIC